MKKTFTIFYSISISLIFIIALSYFGFNIYKNYNKANAEQRIKSLELAIKQIPETCMPGTKEFDKKIDEIIQPLDDFAYLEIKCNNKTIIKYPNENIDASNETSKLIYKSNIISINLYGDMILIKANAYILKPSSIILYIKNTFYIILFATVLTILISIISGKVLDQNTNSEENYEEDEYQSEGDTQTTEISENLNVPPEDSYVEEIYDNDNSQLTQEEAIALQEESISYTVPSETLPSEDIKPMKMQEEGPNGLFSPETGLGWESYLLTRLNNELTRATASELDLSLFEIKIKDLPRSNPETKNVCNILASHFQFKDLIFEYKKDCYVALKIDSNIDSSLTLAQKIKEEIDIALNNKYKCFIGITSRTVRMITGERLLKEADEALNHAIDDKQTNIIAFRADADKYREFIENL